MKASSLIVTSLVLWSYGASAVTVTKTVGANNGPWQASGSLNSAYQYDFGNYSAPTVVSASDGISFTAGLSLVVSYVSGLVSIGPTSGWPYTDANGDTTYPGSPDHGFDNFFIGEYAPSYYMNPATYPIYGSELVGTFANTSGQIVGTPFAIGNLGTFTIPAGATQLQLGVNDVGYGDNGGSWTVQITAVPEPTVTALVLIGLEGLGLTAHQYRRSPVR